MKKQLGQWPWQLLSTNGDGNSAVSSTEIASNSEIIQLAVMVTVTASGNHSSRSKAKINRGSEATTQPVGNSTATGDGDTTTSKKIFFNEQ